MRPSSTGDDLNNVKETIAFGGTFSVTNKPSDASIYFLFVSIVAGSGNSASEYNSIQLYYDLDHGNLYARAARGGFTIFDPWHKYNGTAVS